MLGRDGYRNSDKEMGSSNREDCEWLHKKRQQVGKHGISVQWLRFPTVVGTIMTPQRQPSPHPREL